MKIIASIFGACLLLSLMVLGGGCAAPEAMSEDANRWVSLPVREGMHSAEAWDVVTNSVITKGFMVETSDRDNMYIRSMWFYETLNDEVVRSRVTVKLFGTEESLSVRVYPECTGVVGRCADIPRLYDMIEELTNRLR